MTSELTELAKALPGWRISTETDHTDYVRIVARATFTARRLAAIARKAG